MLRILQCAGREKPGEVQNLGGSMKKYVKEPFGVTKDGLTVTRYTLENENGMRMSVLDYGCRIQKLELMGKDGVMRNVVMGYGEIAPYEGGGCQGALIGRFANRIKNAAFTLDGTEYRLTVNDHMNYIHGSYEHTLFACEPSDEALTFTLTDQAGTFGFPGTLSVKAVYTLTEENAVELSYEAVTDQPTVVNITNHSYFNLDGLPEDHREVSPEEANIFRHKMTVNAEEYLEADEINMVTGTVIPVAGNRFDFREEKEIGAELYDHNFCISGYDGTLRKCAEVKAVSSGIRMEVFTTQPGVQVYSGAKKAVALETQHFPDGPNHPEWPDTTLRPGGVYTEKTGYRFSLY